MLGMVSNMALVKYKSQPLNPLMIASSIIRVMFGISATMAEDDNAAKWVFFILAVAAFLFEMTCTYAIFGLTIADFSSIGSPLGDAVVYRLGILRIIFFTSWATFPIIWFISSTNACILHENVSAVLYLLADAMCKNSYGIVLWSTTWGLLDGKWDRDYPKNRDINGVLMDVDPTLKEEKAEANENFDIKFMGQTLASIKRSKRRPRADLDSVDTVELRESKIRPKKGASRDVGRRSSHIDDYSSDDSYERRREQRRAERRAAKARRAGEDDEDDDDDLAKVVGSDPNIAAIMAAMKRNAEESLRLDALEKEQATRKNDSMC
jgi:hypothetical protein